jgi:hypothetical protein
MILCEKQEDEKSWTELHKDTGDKSHSLSEWMACLIYFTNISVPVFNFQSSGC